MFEVICISFAFVFGLTVRQAGLPPLVGFLAAGFAVNAFGPGLGLPQESGKILEHVAHLGVLLLLFAVGLKLRLGQIAQPQVLGTALVHAGLTTAVVAGGLVVLMGVAGPTALLLGVALSFSSTVLSAKTLETKRDLGALYGRTAIGILIVQDLIALGVLAAAAGKTPSAWALLLLTLPLLRPLLHRLLDLTGHDELLVLMGMLLALVLGGMGFEALGISSELGALAMGLMLSTHSRAKELSEALWGLREVFLVGFFLQIGMSGLPGWGDLAFAVVLALVLPLKGALFFALLAAFRLRPRTAFLAAVSLTAYSEFGLIVGAATLPDWQVALALAVALSFVIAAPLNARAQWLFDRLEPRLQRFEPARPHADERPADLGAARFLVLGMGRTGLAAYERLAAQGQPVAGVDSDPYRALAHRKAGRQVLTADVEDAAFWRGLDLGRIEAAILAMDSIEAKETAARALRQAGFAGPIVSQALWEEHVARLHAAGATETYLTMTQAGTSLAEAALARAAAAPARD